MLVKKMGNKYRARRCEHGTEKYYCKDCGGGGICVHGKQEQQCEDCDDARNLCAWETEVPLP